MSEDAQKIEKAFGYWFTRMTGIPEAAFEWTGDDAPICIQPGFRATGGRRSAMVVLLGDARLSESARQAERDGLIQQARAGLAAAGHQVHINEYGNLIITGIRLLSCKLCYEENGEEIHRHPECSI